jgi:hypothetical protein
MNWGHKITIVIIVFIAGMLGMVWYSFQQTNDMFDANYYAQEKEYQGLMDASQRLKDVAQDPIFSQNEEDIIITIPESLHGNISNGTISFLKVDDQLQDIRVSLHPDSTGIQTIAKSTLNTGMYKVRLKWENDTTLYYTEKNILIN